MIADPSPAVKSEAVTRLLLCSGRVYYDLKAARDAAKQNTVAIARLEQLYPLPVPELKALFGSLPALKDVHFVQEEPRNAGAWRQLVEPLQTALKEVKPALTLTYVGRPESASPATGFLKTHQYEQKLLVEEALQRKA